MIKTISADGITSVPLPERNTGCTFSEGVGSFEVVTVGISGIGRWHPALQQKRNRITGDLKKLVSIKLKLNGCLIVIIQRFKVINPDTKGFICFLYKFGVIPISSFSNLILLISKQLIGPGKSHPVKILQAFKIIVQFIFQVFAFPFMNKMSCRIQS